MRLSVVEHPVPAVIADGDLTSKGASKFRSAVSQAFPPGQRTLVVDLTHVHYVSSDGMRALIGAHKLVRLRGGVMGIAMKEGPLRDLLTNCGLAFQPEVEVFDSLEHCAKHLKSA